VPSSDPSNGYEAAAADFMSARSGVGVAAVRAWARRLPPGGAILDVGAGHGAPLAAALTAEGYALHAVEASPTLAAAFARRLPHTPIACEDAEESSFFGRRFSGVMAIGLVFLLPAERQPRLLARLAAALEPGGRFLFSAPTQVCTWTDVLTGRASHALGAEAYARILANAGLQLESIDADEGGNRYYNARFSPPSES
jgi:SAM-dependent methyltransferase